MRWFTQSPSESKSDTVFDNKDVLLGKSSGVLETSGFWRISLRGSLERRWTIFRLLPRFLTVPESNTVS